MPVPVEDREYPTPQRSQGAGLCLPDRAEAGWSALFTESQEINPETVTNGYSIRAGTRHVDSCAVSSRRLKRYEMIEKTTRDVMYANMFTTMRQLLQNLHKKEEIEPAGESAGLESFWTLAGDSGGNSRLR